MDDTEWDKYGVGNYEKCADCMVHCGFEGTAVKDMVRHPLKALAVALRGVRTEGPMAQDIPLDGQRPAEFVFSAHVERKLAEIRAAGRRQDRGPSRRRPRSRRERPSRPPGRCGSAPAAAAVPPPGSQHSRQIHASIRPHADARRRRQRAVRRIGDHARRRERQAMVPGDAGGDLRFHVHGDRVAGAAQRRLLRRRRRHGVDAEQEAAFRPAAGARPASRSSRDRSAALCRRRARPWRPPSGRAAVPAPARRRCRC